MKTALVFYERGKQKEVNADEYDRLQNYGGSRFICPECGEAVFLTGNKDSNHFAHYKQSDASAECDRRVDGKPTESVYEHIGLPIYMRKSTSDDFYLYMGFKALPHTLMEKAVKESMTIKIDRKSTYRINEERFSCERTSLIPLDYIPLSGSKYSIHYEPANNSVLRHWSDYADGFSFEGAIFTVSEQGGKKVCHGDSITTDVDYYWVRRQPQLPSNMPGIKMEKCGRLILKDNILNVFRGSFLSDISDIEFGYLASYLRTNLKIHLLEKQPEFVPIWPPVIKTEEGYIVNDNDQDIYGHVVSGNDVPKVYVYQSTREVPDQIDINGKLACVRMRGQDVFVNIDRRYVSNGMLFLKRQRTFTANKPEIYMRNDDKYIPLEGYGTYKNCTKILFESSNRTDFILVRNNSQIEKRGGIGEYSFDDLQEGDLIYVLQHRNLKSIITVSIEKATDDMTISDEQLSCLFKKYEGTKKIKLPYKLRFRLYEVKNRFVLSREFLDDVLKSNSISTAMIRVLEEKLNGQK